MSKTRQKYHYKGGKRNAVRVAEKALGRELHFPECVHHVDEDGLNDVPSNLVICPDQAYHMLLHQRTRAYDVCGHADWRYCHFCKKWDAPENLWIYRRAKNWQTHSAHPACRYADVKRRRAQNALK